MPQDGSSIRSAASSQELSARSSASISYRRLRRALASIGLRIARMQMHMLTPQRRPNGRNTMARRRSGAHCATNISLNDEIAHLRGLDLKGLQARWKSMFRRAPPLYLPRHLLFAVLAYRLQADELGDLASDTVRLLKQLATSSTTTGAMRLTSAFDRRRSALKPGTILSREWNGQTYRVMVLDKGFGWNGEAYVSLSQVALAITGTRWNGPRFFGLRDKTLVEATA